MCTMSTIRGPAKDPAWVVGFCPDLYPGNPTLGPYAGALYPRRVGALVRFSPVKGAKRVYVQRCGPASAEKADPESSDSEEEIGGAEWKGFLGKREKGRWEEKLQQHLLLPSSPTKRVLRQGSIVR